MGRKMQGKVENAFCLLRRNIRWRNMAMVCISRTSEVLEASQCTIKVRMITFVIRGELSLWISNSVNRKLRTLINFLESGIYPSYEIS